MASIFINTEKIRDDYINYKQNAMLIIILCILSSIFMSSVLSDASLDSAADIINSTATVKASFVLSSDGVLSALQLLASSSLDDQKSPNNTFLDSSENHDSNGNDNENDNDDGDENSEINHNYIFPDLKPKNVTESEIKGLITSCPDSMRDFVSCKMQIMLNSSGLDSMGVNLRRFCDYNSLNQSVTGCFIDVPKDYSPPYPWPQSQHQVKLQNAPAVPLLGSERSKDWIIKSKDGSQLYFLQKAPIPAFKSIDAYIDHISEMSPSLSFGKGIRLVLDIGPGSGSLNTALAKRGVLTLTITNISSSENGVQLIAERGFPALLQTLNMENRLPYPDQSFDLLHSTDTSISWTDNGGLLLFEADRLVRAGGFIVFVINPSINEMKASTDIRKLASDICLETVVDNSNLILWRKPTDSDCYLHYSTAISQLCQSPESTSWMTSLNKCLVGLTRGTAAPVELWPERLTSPPLRLYQVQESGVKDAKLELYQADLNYWQFLVSEFYLNRFDSSIIRNVLDMNAGYGGFAAALALAESYKHWWVLNVIPPNTIDRLPVVFDRGLLGIYHDWCMALDTYPRTFDMIHVSGGLFSTIELRCNVSNVVLEMDRLLRPGGVALIRDRVDVILEIEAITSRLKWKTTVSQTENGPLGIDKVLYCKKPLNILRSQISQRMRG